MNRSAGGENERAQHLMMAALDHEISEIERLELEEILGRNGELREEWERMRRVKEVTGMISLRKPPDEVWSTYWTSVYNRAERGLAWVLVSLGAIVLGSWGAWEFVSSFLAETETPFLVKGAVLILVIGGVILAVSVVREKLFTRSHDPYREIQR
jgi:ferric-dicitrate binding protein FerR (iron transport regulator)